MCKCKSKLSAYDPSMTAVLTLPDNIELYYDSDPTERRTTISIDACMVEEIQYLWSQGVQTESCCCGHNYRNPYIAVDDDSIQKMKDLGYKVMFNPNSFYPWDEAVENFFHPKKHYIYED